MTYPVICAWCQAVIRYGPVAGSHGACEACADKLRAEFRAAR